MKQSGLAVAVLMMATMCAAQGMPSQPQANGSDAGPNTQGSADGAQATRMSFGEMCGIADSDPKRAVALSRSPEGTWHRVAPGMRPEPNDNAVARVWGEQNWMVDLHEAPGPVMHIGQLCFSAVGNILFLIDSYMDIPACTCVRFTERMFDKSGRVVRWEQKYLEADTGVEIAAPEAASQFPEVFEFRKLEQLPFYSLVWK